MAALTQFVNDNDLVCGRNVVRFGSLFVMWFMTT